jgi:hypothetical protein
MEDPADGPTHDAPEKHRNPLLDAGDRSESHTYAHAGDDAADDGSIAGGYAPSLLRGLSGITNFAVCFTEVACLVSTILIFPVGLANGGPVVVLWSFVLTAAMVLNVAHCMAEVCAAYPAAGECAELPIIVLFYHHAAMAMAPSQLVFGAGIARSLLKVL